MGKCILQFDQIQIINQKSASGQFDSDWLILHWFAGGGVKQSHVFPLPNSTGSTKIASGNSLQPVTFEVSCQDGDLVAAAFQIVNLGSSGVSEQVQQAGQIASEVAQALTNVYVDIAEFVITNFLPLGSVFGAGLNEVQPAIVATVKTAFDDVIIPFVDEVAGIVAGLFGNPNCNGDVLHDLVLFPPSEPDPSVATSKVYTASSKSGCGSPAKTSVVFTQERVMDVAPIFVSEPSPKVDAAPATGESPDSWLGIWVEDPLTPTPIIAVTISRSTAASGSYAVSVLEHVDRRFNAVFEAADTVEVLESVTVPLFGGNVFGRVQTWLKPAMSPGDLQVYVKKTSRAASGGARTISGGSVGPPAVTFKMGWSRLYTSAFSKPSGIVIRGPGGHAAIFGYQTVDAFVLEGKGVAVCLYRFTAGGQVVGRGVRYVRDESTLHTRADVMLVRRQTVA
jgi:hypothetical protein